MESYIHLYKTNSEFTEAYNGPDYKEPWLSLTEENMTIGYSKPKLIDFSAEPLTFNIVSAGSINWTVLGSSAKTIEYKLNDGNWASITSKTEGAKITVDSGDKVQFRGNNAQYCDGTSSFNMFSGSTAEFEVEGNIMSLVNSTDFATLTALESNFTFASLFTDCTGLTSAENLILPADTLADYCYAAMFAGCTSLTTAPALPANTLANFCYNSMFNGCTSLATVPSNLLPATTLADSCYRNMFQNCNSLTTAPELPATTLAQSCYNSMFQGCTKLNYIKCLATDISASNCTFNWVPNVASTGTFVKAAGMTGWGTGDSGIPKGWTVQDA